MFAQAGPDLDLDALYNRGTLVEPKLRYCVIGHGGTVMFQGHLRYYVIGYGGNRDVSGASEVLRHRLRGNRDVSGAAGDESAPGLPQQWQHSGCGGATPSAWQAR